MWHITNSDIPLWRCQLIRPPSTAFNCKDLYFQLNQSNLQLRFFDHNKSLMDKLCSSITFFLPFHPIPNLIAQRRWRHWKLKVALSDGISSHLINLTILSVKQCEGQNAMRTHSTFFCHPRNIVRGTIFKHIPWLRHVSRC